VVPLLLRADEWHRQQGLEMRAEDEHSALPVPHMRGDVAVRVRAGRRTHDLV